MTADKFAVTTATQTKPRVFRSPVAVAVWWLWALFAIGNLIDLGVQGRDHTSLVAAFILVVATGIVYVTAQRPKIIAADDGLTVRNPIRDHEIPWRSVTKFDALDLIRVHCEWSAEGAGEPSGRRVIHAWAVHASRRRQATVQLRSSGRGGMLGTRGSPRVGQTGRADGYGSGQQGPVPTEADQVVRALTDCMEQARGDGPAGPPVSSWRWQAMAAIIVPAIALVIVCLT